MEQMNVCGDMWSHCVNTVLEVSNTFGSFTLKHKDVSVSESLTQSLVVRLWFIWWNELDHRRLLLQIFCCCCCKDDLQFSFFIKIFIRNKNFSNVKSVFHFFTKHNKHRESQWLFTVIHQHYWQNSNFIIADLICSALLTIWKLRVFWLFLLRPARVHRACGIAACLQRDRRTSQMGFTLSHTHTHARTHTHACTHTHSHTYTDCLEDRDTNDFLFCLIKRLTNFFLRRTSSCWTSQTDQMSEKKIH